MRWSNRLRRRRKQNRIKESSDYLLVDALGDAEVFDNLREIAFGENGDSDCIACRRSGADGLGRR